MELEETHGKICRLPMVSGSFCYDAKKGIALPDPKQQLIWNFDSSEITFQDVVSRVKPCSLSEFLEGVTKKEPYTETGIIKLVNGNEIKEKYSKIYHPEDYEYNSLLEIEGETELQLTGTDG